MTENDSPVDKISKRVGRPLIPKETWKLTWESKVSGLKRKVEFRDCEIAALKAENSQIRNNLLDEIENCMFMTFGMKDREKRLKTFINKLRSSTAKKKEVRYD